MAYCPNCRCEYEEPRDTCADCGSSLVAGDMPAGAAGETRPGGQWSFLSRVRRRDSAEIIRGLLDSAAIQCEVIDKTLSEMPLTLGEPSSYLEIWVPEESVGEARGVLNEAREGTAPCPACGHMSSVEETSCEYCGAPSV